MGFRVEKRFLRSFKVLWVRVCGHSRNQSTGRISRDERGVGNKQND